MLFRSGLFAVEERAMRLQKVALACRAVELTPGATTGMAIGPEMAKPEPAPIVTMAVRTKVPGGVDLAGPPICRGHGVGRYRRVRLGLSGSGWAVATGTVTGRLDWVRFNMMKSQMSANRTS